MDSLTQTTTTVHEGGQTPVPGATLPATVPGANSAPAPGPHHEQRNTEDSWTFIEAVDPSSAKDEKTKDGKKKDCRKNKAGKGSFLSRFCRSEPELTCSQCNAGLGFTMSQLAHPELAAELRCQG